MPTKRTYDDGCPSAHALDLVGDRWALIIVRELLFGPKRFTDLRNNLSRISPNVLAQRLREMSERGIVQQLKVSPYAEGHAYELTPWGQQLESLLLALARWGAQSPTMPWDRPMTSDGILVTMKAFLDHQAAGGLAVRIMLWLEDAQFGVVLANGHLHVTHAEIDRPEVLIRTDRDTLLEMLTNRLAPERALLANKALIAGDIGILKQFLGLFPICRAPQNQVAAQEPSMDDPGIEGEEESSAYPVPEQAAVLPVP
jgi:DNA-binding HxlR family transcriptional regulator/putative sterol carrier protein